MVLHNAADSLADLLQLKQEQQLQSLQKPISNPTPELGGLENARDSVSDLSVINNSSRRRSFRKRRDCTYELDDEVEEDDDAPIWEMDMSNAWSGDGGAAADSFADEEGNVYSMAVANEPHRCIAECEQIFTVPEVFDDLMEGDSKREGMWGKLLSFCWSSNESHTRNGAFQDSIEMKENQTKDQKMKQMSLAVQLYMDMPLTQRQSCNPSLYKVYLVEEGGTEQAYIVGNRRQIYENQNYGSIVTTRSNIHSTRRVHFSEMKRVLKIRKFTYEEATQVWYQREDFAHFKAEMTLLIRDMEASKELAAMWLDSEECERRRSSSMSSSCENLNSKDSNNNMCNKENSKSSNHHKSRSWWHDYDHSRRGLERYASPCQARQILASYKVATNKVFAEQRRQTLQKLFLPCILTPDPYQNADRIAMIYHEYTAWSADLALAAGASDADAVRTNFNNDTRKTREYYILKQVIGNGYRVHKHMPEFMMPKCITPKGFLDENETLLGRHYSDLDRTMRKRESMIERAQKSILGGGSLTGEEAREEMSHLISSDLSGPISPALAPMLDLKDENGDEGSICSSLSPRRPEKRLNAEVEHGKKQSLAAKAKNYPFQQ